MRQASTLSLGGEVPQESMAVASVVQADHAEVGACGNLGTRPCAIEPRIRQRPSHRTPRGLVLRRALGLRALPLAAPKRPWLLGRGARWDPHTARGAGHTQAPGGSHTCTPDARGGPPHRRQVKRF